MMRRTCHPQVHAQAQKVKLLLLWTNHNLRDQAQAGWPVAQLYHVPIVVGLGIKTSSHAT